MASLNTAPDLTAIAAGVEAYNAGPSEKFEAIAEVFHERTGMLAPGKDDASGMHPREDRERAWGMFTTNYAFERLQQANADLTALLALVRAQGERIAELEGRIATRNEEDHARSIRRIAQGQGFSLQSTTRRGERIMSEKIFRQPLQVNPDVWNASPVELHGGPADGVTVKAPQSFVVICIRKDHGDNALVALPRTVNVFGGESTDQVKMAISMGGYLGHYEWSGVRFEYRDQRGDA